MTKKCKYEPLVVGQRIWLEELPWYHSRDDERSVREYEISRANGTSAYAVRVDCIEHYNKGERVPEVKIEQRTYRAKNTVSRFNVWLSELDFQNNIVEAKEISELRSKAIHLVRQMNADELRKVLEI